MEIEDRQHMGSAQGEDLAAQLGALLTEQIAFARQGNMGQVERLGGRVEALIAAVTPEAANLPQISGAQRDRLQRLYAELVLVLKAEQADVRTKLKQVQQVKRVVGVYNRKKQRR